MVADLFEIFFKKCQHCGKHMHGGRHADAYCSSECYVQAKIKKTDELIETGQVKDRVSLRSYLLRHHGHKCGVCGDTHHNHVPVRLMLNFIDGDYQNFSLDNLRLICAYCFATENSVKECITEQPEEDVMVHVTSGEFETHHPQRKQVRRGLYRRKVKRNFTKPSHQAYM